MKQDVYTSEARLQAILDELEHAHDLDSKAYTRIARRRLFKLIGNLAGMFIITFLSITWLQVEDARSRGEVPTVCDYQICEAKAGSVVPTIPVKSLILSCISKDAAKLAVGDIVTFQDNGVTITYRIVEVIQGKGAIGYRIKGDNPANSIDPNILTPDHIQTVYVMKLPFRFTSEGDQVIAIEQAKKRAQCVLMEHVGSMEYYQSPQQDPKQVFSDINFEALEGEVWAILGTSALGVRLLLEIITSARPYKDGHCVLAQKGMMRKKRTILPYIYYIGSTNMLSTNMNVLEYLMHIAAREQGDAVVRQKRVLEKITELNMDYVALSIIGNLTPSERSVVMLLVSLFTESKLIIWNLARLEYDERSLQAIAAICEEIRKQKRTLLFSTFDYQLIERCATHIAPLYDGRLPYTGTVEAFMQTQNHLGTIIQDAHITAIRHATETAHSDYTVLERDQTLYVWGQEQKTGIYHSIWKLLTEHQLRPDSIRRHPLCTENAWKEVRNHHDLQP